MRTIRAILLASMCVAVPLSALAAPFCAVTAIGKNCWYFSMDQCRQAAGPAGACVVNGDEVRSTPGGAPFCVATSFGTLNCWYYDARACQQNAQSSGGACVVNPNR